MFKPDHMVTECILANFTLRSWCSVFCIKERLGDLHFFNEWRWCLTVLPRQRLQSQCCCPEEHTSPVEVDGWLLKWCSDAFLFKRGQEPPVRERSICHLEMARRIYFRVLRTMQADLIIYFMFLQLYRRIYNYFGSVNMRIKSPLIRVKEKHH